MANRRMFSKDVVESDQFLDMSKDAQCLYFHFGLIADDDGFVSAPIRTCRMVGVDESVVDELIKSGYITRFNSGVIVINQWNENNYIEPQKYKSTVYAKELQEISQSGKYKVRRSTRIEHEKCTVSAHSIEQNSSDQINSDQKSRDQGSTDQGITKDPQEILDICRREHINLDAYRVAAFIDEMNKSNWKWNGEPIKSLSKVLRVFEKNYSERSKAFLTGDGMGYNL